MVPRAEAVYVRNVANLLVLLSMKVVPFLLRPLVLPWRAILTTHSTLALRRVDEGSATSAAVVLLLLAREIQESMCYLEVWARNF